MHWGITRRITHARGIFPKHWRNCFLKCDYAVLSRLCCTFKDGALKRVCPSTAILVDLIKTVRTTSIWKLTLINIEEIELRSFSLNYTYDLRSGRVPWLLPLHPKFSGLLCGNLSLHSLSLTSLTALITTWHCVIYYLCTVSCPSLPPEYHLHSTGALAVCLLLYPSTNSST